MIRKAALTAAIAVALGSQVASAQTLQPRYLPFDDPALADQGVHERYYLLSDGRSYCPAGATPKIVLVLHGGSGYAEYTAKYSRMHQKAKCAIVAYPNGTANTEAGPTITGAAWWNPQGSRLMGMMTPADVDDAGFLDALIESIAIEFALPKRAYMAGISEGGIMTYDFACRYSSSLVAIAPVAATSYDWDCAPGNRVAVMHTHGVKDTVIPWAGKTSPFMPPVSLGLAAWAATDQCSAQVQSFGTTGNGCVRYQGCASQRPVQWCVVNGAGHTWPKTKTYDTTLQVWAFFDTLP